MAFRGRLPAERRGNARASVSRTPSPPAAGCAPGPFRSTLLRIRRAAARRRRGTARLEQELSPHAMELGLPRTWPCGARRLREDVVPGLDLARAPMLVREHGEIHHPARLLSGALPGRQGLAHPGEPLATASPVDPRALDHATPHCQRWYQCEGCGRWA